MEDRSLTKKHFLEDLQERVEKDIQQKRSKMDLLERRIYDETRNTISKALEKMVRDGYGEFKIDGL